jgi:predicted O-linked N-acetylglucosamine transferase (SPINDLY family)
VGLFHAGRHPELEQRAQQLLERFPHSGLVWNLLGACLQVQNRDALFAFEKAAEFSPDDADVHNNLGLALHGAGRYAESEVHCQKALALRGQFAAAHNNLGNAQVALGNQAGALTNYRRAIALRPDYAEPYKNVGNIELARGEIVKAIASYEKALTIQPNYADAQNSLALAHAASGDLYQGLAGVRKALEQNPESFEIHSGLLFLLSHSEQPNPKSLFTEHCRVADKFAEPLRPSWPQHKNSCQENRPIQVGFVSADFCGHVIAQFLGPVLEHLTKVDGLVLHAYYNFTVEDGVTQALRKHFDHWHAVAGITHDALAKQVVADGIDILIDLSSHTKGNRLLAFARKPAPIQVTWLGYPGTTGLQAMDYCLADANLFPFETFESQFTEKLVHLPALAPFEPSAAAPAINDLPALAKGFVTFGSFNRTIKINHAVVACWAQLMHALPTSKLLLEGAPEDAKCMDWLAELGIGRERILWHGRNGVLAYQQLHHQVDICLDTFPYNGATTTWNAAWMGVPTLTLAGSTPAGRYGAAIMGHMGLQAFVASDVQDFVGKGVYWASHLAELAELRAGMRARFAQSPAGQPALIASALANALRTMWQRWCKGLPAKHFVAAVEPLGTNAPAAAPPDSVVSALIQLFQTSQLGELERQVTLLLDQFPNWGFGWKVLSVAQLSVGKNALTALQKAALFLPGDAEIHNNLGSALYSGGQVAQAMDAYRQAIAIAPTYADAHKNLGLAFKALNQREEAVQSFRQALALKPDDIQVHDNLGRLLMDSGQHSEAATCFQYVVSMHPANADAHNQLGAAQFAMKHYSAALGSYQRALSLHPDAFVPLNNLAMAQHALGQLSDAAATYQRLIVLHPHDAGIHNDLGNALLGLGLMDQAVASFEQALTMKPDLYACHSNLLFALSHSDKLDAQALFTAHSSFADVCETPLRNTWPQHGNPREPNRPLQVGFVSGDLYSHVVARFAGPLLAQLSKRPDLALHAYATGEVQDNVTAILKGFFKHWHQVEDLTDTELAKQIGDDGIDILIDLSGHTKGNRLRTFAHKPAPVLMSWLGYPGTTGLQSIDYYLADAFVLPHGRFDDQFTEKIVRLPALAPFQQSDTVPAINALPALTNGYVTFGSFNRTSKINRTVITCWANLLRALPNARLLIEGVPDDAECMAWLRQEGIGADRLSWHARKGVEAYNLLHHQVDICLDTFPYNGATTTWSAVLMGVPTLTIAGTTPASHYGAAIMSQLGLESFVASDAQDFVRKGVYWAAHLTELADIRTGMRERFRQCPAGQPELIATALSNALRTMWQRWCSGLPAQAFMAATEVVPAPL